MRRNVICNFINLLNRSDGKSDWSCMEYSVAQAWQRCCQSGLARCGLWDVELLCDNAHMTVAVLVHIMHVFAWELMCVSVDAYLLANGRQHEYVIARECERRLSTFYREI